MLLTAKSELKHDFELNFHTKYFIVFVTSNLNCVTCYLTNIGISHNTYFGKMFLFPIVILFCCYNFVLVPGTILVIYLQI